VCIGDVDDALRGNEVVTVGFSNNATVLHRDGDGWRKVIALPLGSPGKTAVFFRGGAAVACAGGTVTVVEKKEGDVWETAVINESDAGRARIATDGHRILVACDDGGLRLLDEGLTTEIYRETDKLRGAVLADLDPYVDGIEAATAGYGKTMTVLYPGEDKWTPVTLVRDTGRFHHLTCGELLEAGAGKELVGCSYSGRVIVASRVPE
jgi:hypothetical protein